MDNFTTLTRKQIGVLETIASTIEADDYGSVCAVKSDDDLIAVELKESGSYSNRYTRYVDGEGLVWRYDSEHDKMVRATVFPERGSYHTTHPHPRTVHYVY